MYYIMNICSLNVLEIYRGEYSCTLCCQTADGIVPFRQGLTDRVSRDTSFV